MPGAMIKEESGGVGGKKAMTPHDRGRACNDGVEAGEIDG